jgi:hypothetical protein
MAKHRDRLLPDRRHLINLNQPDLKPGAGHSIDQHLSPAETFERLAALVFSTSIFQSLLVLSFVRSTQQLEYLED